MKDATLKDIYPKKNYPTTQLCVYLNGSWQFAAPTSPVRKTQGNTVSYYKINKKFGIAHSRQVNPAKTTSRGEAGDYLVEDMNHAYSIMKVSQYKMFFPLPRYSDSQIQATKTTAQTSQSLDNPKFIGKIVEQYEDPNYNT